MATAAPPRAKAEARVVTLLPAATEIGALAHGEHAARESRELPGLSRWRPARAA